jgi:nicotinamidase-related amidase
MNDGKAALLIMHAQPALIGMPGGDAIFPAVGEATAGARKAGVEVIYTTISYRSGYPELADDDPTRGFLAEHDLFVRGTGDGVDERVAPAEGEIVLSNQNPNAFAGCELDQILRARRIDNLVLAGLTTSGVVFGTATQATGLSYGVTVLSDAVSDPNPVLQEELLKLFAEPTRKMQVTTTEEWVKGL